jgi:hypothetical protein
VTRPTTIARALSLTVFAVVASFGCNGLLGNEEGTPRAPQDSTEKVSPDGGGGGVVCDTTRGNKVCFGLCVKIDQPNTGCGASSCAACDPKNVIASACEGGAETLACGYDECKPGFDNCDGKTDNGCETSLGAKDSCGSCTTKCAADTPFCAMMGAVASCVATCPQGTQPCDGACVDTATSVENCGNCGTKCQRVSASATCEAGSCKYVCATGTHECGQACVSDLDPRYCGASCTPCPAGGPNTVPTCSALTCGVACAPGFLDCDATMTNGCEVQGSSCPLPPANCGGGPCAFKQICCNGQCIADNQLCIGLPPPPQPD